MTYYKKQVKIAIISLFCSIFAITTDGYSSDGQMAKHNKMQLYGDSFLEEGVMAPGFILIDQDGKRVSLEQFRGRPIFLTFIYTSCINECPLVLHNRKELEKSIEEKTGSGLVFIAVTVDPANDKPAILKEYINTLMLDPEDLYLLTGKSEDVKKVLRNYKVKIAKVAETGKVVGHPNMGYIIDRNGVIKKVLLFAF